MKKYENGQYIPMTEEEILELAAANSEGPPPTRSGQFVTPQMFGALADGSTDDTHAINAAIDAVDNDGIVYFPQGTYLVSSSMEKNLGSDRYVAVKIKDKENLTLWLSPQATIKHAPQSYDECAKYKTSWYFVIAIHNSKNIQVVGGHVEGEADSHEYHIMRETNTIGEAHGYGINIKGSENVCVQNVEISNCYGDGISIGPYNGVKNKNIVIDGCKIHHHIRQGITLGGADHTQIRNCEIYDIRGGLPQSGIDMEPNFVSEINVDTLIDNCYIHNVAGYALVQSKSKHTTIKGCRLMGRVMTEGDDCSDVRYTNCDIATYNSSNLYKNMLYNCRIGMALIADAGDDFIDCHFETGIFNDEMNDINSLPSLIDIINTGSANKRPDVRFYNCKLISLAEKDGSYQIFRNNGRAKDVVFDACEIVIGKHPNWGLYVVSQDAITMQNCKIKSIVNGTCTKQFLQFDTPKLVFANNTIDVTDVTAASNYSLMNITTKDSYIMDNIFFANSAISKYLFKQALKTDASEAFYLRNIATQWGSLGSLPSSDAVRLVSSNNILAGGIL